MTPPQGPRLDSWKAIAYYFGRNVRTVTRWYVERGLPIHHVPGGKRGHVFAFTAELDAWLLNHKNGPAAVASPSLTANQHSAPELATAHSAPSELARSTTVSLSPDEATRNFLPRRLSFLSFRWRITLAAGLLLATAAAVSLTLHPASSHQTELFAIKYDVDTLVATNPEGRTLWTHRFADSALIDYFAARPDVPKPFRIAD